MRHGLLASLSVCVTMAGCTGAAVQSQGHVGLAGHADVASRELPPLDEHTFGDDKVGFTGSVESVGSPVVDENDGLVRVTLPLGTAEPMRCYIYAKPLNLAQTLRMFINHVADSVARQSIDDVHAGQIDGAPFIAVHTSYLPRTGADAAKAATPGQLKYFAARGDSHTLVCMHDESGYHATFERIAKKFVTGLAFTDDQGDPAAKLVVWHDVSEVRVGGVAVGVVEHRLYEGETGYAYAVSTSMLLPGEGGQVIANDELDNQFSDTQGSLVEGTYVKILNDSVAFNMGLHYEKGEGYHIKGAHNGAPIDVMLKSEDALPDFASQTALLRHVFASAQSDGKAHWLGFSPDAPGKLVHMDFTKNASDAQHKRGVLAADGQTSEVEIDNLGTPTAAKTAEITVQRVWLAKGQRH